MEKKNIGLGVAALAAGAGAVALAAKNHKNNVKNEVKKAAANAPEQEYRNTERGKDKKNSKGIYYTNGNYEAFARPKKPQGVDEKSAYIVGSGPCFSGSSLLSGKRWTDAGRSHPYFGGNGHCRWSM